MESNWRDNWWLATAAGASLAAAWVVRGEYVGLSWVLFLAGIIGMSWYAVCGFGQGMARVEKAARTVVIQHRKAKTVSSVQQLVRQYALVDQAIEEYRIALDASASNVPHSGILHLLEEVVGQRREGTDWFQVYDDGVVWLEQWLRFRVLWRIPLA